MIVCVDVDYRATEVVAANAKAVAAVTTMHGPTLLKRSIGWLDA